MTVYKKGPEIPTTYKIGRATVRMHGTPNREIIEPAAARFLAKVEQKKRKAAKGRRAGDAGNKTAVR